MLPSSIMTFMSFTQQPSTPLKVLVARATAWSMASSKPCSEMALSSVTLAMLMRSCLPDRSLAAYPVALRAGPLLCQIPGGALLVLGFTLALLRASLGLLFAISTQGAAGLLHAALGLV